jgi:hypothetical protein
MTYQAEFPDFAPETMPAIPAHWEDVSWHNDSCPAFWAATDVLVFIDYEDRTQREWPDGERFTARVEAGAGAESEFYTDDWEALLAWIAQQGELLI